MSDLRQTIRYCKAPNGMAIAWSTMGSGPPVVECRVAGHLENELRKVPSVPFLRALSERHTLIRYNGRGVGLSDQPFDEVSLENSVADLECVVDAAGVDRFALVARTSGCAESVTYAARHPERVSRLVVIGGFAGGSARAAYSNDFRFKRDAIVAAIEAGWDDPNPGFRRLFLSRRFPRATPEEMASMERYTLTAGSGRFGAAMIRYQANSDLSELATRVRCPALILHGLRDIWVPLSSGRALASLVPNARLVALDTDASDPLPSDPAFSVLLREVLDFLGEERDPTKADVVPFADLTARERDVLELIARGLDNLQIAAHLNISEKTVRNNITPIFDKLGVENRAQAIVKARDAGMGKAK